MKCDRPKTVQLQKEQAGEKQATLKIHVFIFTHA